MTRNIVREDRARSRDEGPAVLIRGAGPPAVEAPAAEEAEGEPARARLRLAEEQDERQRREDDEALREGADHERAEVGEVIGANRNTIRSDGT